MAAMIPVATTVFSKSQVFADFAHKGTIVAIRVEGFDLSVRGASLADPADKVEEQVAAGFTLLA